MISKIEKLSNDKQKVVSQSEKKYQTIMSKEEFLSLIDKIQQSDLISFDLETTSTKPLKADIVGLSFSFSAHSGYYIPINFLEKSVENQ